MEGAGHSDKPRDMSFAKHLVDGIFLVLILFMFGAGNLIWPDEEMTGLGRLLLFVVLAYLTYRIGIGVGRNEK